MQGASFCFPIFQLVRGFWRISGRFVKTFQIVCRSAYGSGAFVSILFQLLPGRIFCAHKNYLLNLVYEVKVYIHIFSKYLLASKMENNDSALWYSIHTKFNAADDVQVFKWRPMPNAHFPSDIQGGFTKGERTSSLLYI
jgi:hypothetical protein